MNAHMHLLLADDGGSFTIAPNLGLVVWTVLWIAMVASLVYFLVRWARRR